MWLFDKVSGKGAEEYSKNTFFSFVPYMAQSVKNLHAVQETRVRFLGQEDPLEEDMATHSSILAWRILWMGEPGGLQSMGSQESDRTWRLNHHHQPISKSIPGTRKQ